MLLHLPLSFACKSAQCGHIGWGNNAAVVGGTPVSNGWNTLCTWDRRTGYHVLDRLR